MDYQFLAGILLFQGLSPNALPDLLTGLGAGTRFYPRGEAVLRTGDRTGRLGLVLSGGVNIENHDAWGNRTILDHVAPGQVFAETYACVPGEPLMVDVAAVQDTEVLFLDMGLLLSGEGPHHGTLLRNLLTITARKNLALSRRIFYTSSKTIRGRLLSYLSDQAVLQNSPSFSIPFDSQQLADYLGVDRSALSNELGKMRRDGLLSARKSHFRLNVSQMP